MVDRTQKMPSGSTQRWRSGLLLTCALALVACSADGSVTGDASPDGGQDSLSELTGDGLRLMTLNMYLGASVSSLIDVTPLQVPLRVAELWAAIADSDVNDRVGSMAAAIARLQPHVVALQEAVLIRQQVPGDYLEGNPVQASEVVWDFVDLLQAALTEAGQRYEVAVTQDNADIEVPRLDGESLADARLTDRDVILVRDGVGFSEPGKGRYDTSLTVDPIEIKRGYVAVSVVYQGETYRVVDTHLEAADEGPEVRIPQAHQLVEELADESRPLILLGDINSPAPDGGAYAVIADGGYRDLWTADPAAARGATCCQSADLRGASALAQRIDIIFARNWEPTEVEAVTALDTEAERTAAGLWPTDHAAVAVRLVP